MITSTEPFWWYWRPTLFVYHYQVSTKCNWAFKVLSLAQNSYFGVLWFTVTLAGNYCSLILLLEEIFP